MFSIKYLFSLVGLALWLGALAAPAPSDLEISSSLFSDGLLVHRDNGNNEATDTVGSASLNSSLTSGLEAYKLELIEKVAKIREYFKYKIDKELEKGKERLENIKAIWKEFINHTKEVTKEVSVEGLEFLGPYEDDLRTLLKQLVSVVNS